MSEFDVGSVNSGLNVNVNVGMCSGPYCGAVQTVQTANSTIQKIGHNFVHPNPQTCRAENQLAAVDSLIAIGFGTASFANPLWAPFTVPAGLGATGAAAITKTYTAFACP